LDLHGDTVTNTDVCDLKGKRLRASFQPCPRIFGHEKLGASQCQGSAFDKNLASSGRDCARSSARCPDAVPEKLGYNAERLYGRLVLRASQSSRRNVHAKNGNTPYNVSLTECEWRSIARKTLMQKATAARHTTVPATDIGR